MLGSFGAVAWAQVPPVPSPGPEFTNPLRAGSFEELFTNVMTGLQGIIVVLAIIFIIVGALMYITSAGNEKQMTLGKSAILAAMIGLALGIAAPSFLREIGTILGWTGVAGNPVVSGANSLSEIASNVLKFLLSIVVILGIIMLIIGGMAYLTSAGDEGRAETGKKIVIYSIIGIAVTMVSMVLVTQIANFFAP